MSDLDIDQAEVERSKKWARDVIAQLEDYARLENPTAEQTRQAVRVLVNINIRFLRSLGRMGED